MDRLEETKLKFLNQIKEELKHNSIDAIVRMIETSIIDIVFYYAYNLGYEQGYGDSENKIDYSQKGGRVYKPKNLLKSDNVE